MKSEMNPACYAIIRWGDDEYQIFGRFAMEDMERAEVEEPRDANGQSAFLRRTIVATNLTEEETVALMALLRHGK